MYKVNSFAEAVEKLDELVMYEYRQLSQFNVNDFLSSKEDSIGKLSFAGFQYWIMQNFIYEDREMINEFKKNNINNVFSMAMYIMKGFWRFRHNKLWSLESMLNEQIMEAIIQ